MSNHKNIKSVSTHRFFLILVGGKGEGFQNRKINFKKCFNMSNHKKSKSISTCRINSFQKVFQHVESKKNKIEISKSVSTCRIIKIQKMFQHVESNFFKKCFNMLNKKNQTISKIISTCRIKINKQNKQHNNHKKVFRHVESKKEKEKSFDMLNKKIQQTNKKI